METFEIPKLHFERLLKIENFDSSINFGITTPI